MQETYRRINLSLSKIERKLLILLRRFYNKYIKGSINPVEIIRQQRGQYIANKVVDAIVDSLKVSGKTPKDVTDEEYRIIFKLADEQVTQFWKTVSRLRMREDELKTVPAEQIVEPVVVPEKVYKPELNVEAALIGFASWTAFAAFNTGILLATLDSPNRERVIFLTRGDKTVDKKICRPLHGRIFYADDPLLPKLPIHNHCHCMIIPYPTQ